MSTTRVRIPNSKYFKTRHLCDKCGKQVSPDYFCFGCECHICNGCETSEPWLEHEFKDHFKGVNND